MDPEIAEILARAERARTAIRAREDSIESYRAMMQFAEGIRALWLEAAAERGAVARRIRENEGLTFAELADRLDMSKVRVHQLVHGTPKRRPKKKRPPANARTAPPPALPPVPSLPEIEIGEADLATAHYRLYDTTGVLLYTGITDNIKIRFTQHKLDKLWWPEVARRTVTWYGSRTDALCAEDIAIRTEHPIHNGTG